MSLPATVWSGPRAGRDGSFRIDAPSSRSSARHFPRSSGSAKGLPSARRVPSPVILLPLDIDAPLDEGPAVMTRMVDLTRAHGGRNRTGSPRAPLGLPAFHRRGDW